MSNRKRMVCLVLAFITLITVFAGCSAAKSPDVNTPAESKKVDSETSKSQGESGEAKQGEPAKPFDGENIRLIVTRHNWTDEVIKILPGFEELTGIKVNIEEVSPEDQLNNKLSVESAAGGKTLDAFMTRPLQEGIIFRKNGWYFPVGDLAAKDAEYNVDDLFRRGA